MSSLTETPVAHPTVRLLEAVAVLLAEHRGSPVWTMTPAELLTQLPAVATLVNELVAVQLQMLCQAQRHHLGDPVGAANTAAWWATTTRTTKKAAHRHLALATGLDHETHQPTATAMTHGHLNTDQAAVILEAVEALPPDLTTPALRTHAEQHLVALAEHHDPTDLRILGRKILDVLAPQIAEEHQRRTLEHEEQHAAATASLTMNPDGHGSIIGRFKIPTLAGAILRTHLDALAAPRHRAATNPKNNTGPETVAAQPPQPTGSNARVSQPLRLGQAFVEYLETRAKTGTPKAGGLAATVVVTMTLENLLGGNRPATLDTTDTISASQARRLACEAGIIPAVLGTRSQVLDLGRKTRFHTEPQRIALAHRDRGCAAEHCDWPPGRCHAHHPTPWSHGGHTTITNGLLLCPRHHTLAHDPRYHPTHHDNGKITFTRRTAGTSGEPPPVGAQQQAGAAEVSLGLGR